MSLADIKDEIVQVLHDALASDGISDVAASRLLAVVEKMDAFIIADPPFANRKTGVVHEAFAATNLHSIPMTDEVIVGDALNGTVTLPSGGNGRENRGSVVFLETMDDQPNKWLAKTYSGYGSFRRQTIFTGSPTGAIVPQALSFRGAGMPMLDLNAAPDPRTQFSRPFGRHTEVLQVGDHLFDEARGYGYDVYELDNISSADFDVLSIAESNHLRFLLVATNVYFQYSFVTSLQFDIKSFMQFLDKLSSASANCVFHGALHAANALQATHQYFMQPGVKENFTDLEIFGALFSATALCLGRFGATNEFLSQVGHPVVRVFGDFSPTESFSVAAVFLLLDRHNFLANSVTWNSDPLNNLVLRELTNEILLRSASRFHEELLHESVEMVSEGVIQDRNIPRLLSAVVHAADMAYATKSTDTFLLWAARSVEQGFIQGDEERRRGISVSAMFERSVDPTTVVQAQLMWLRIIVRPFLMALQKVLPDPWLERLEANVVALHGVVELPQLIVGDAERVLSFSEANEVAMELLIGVFQSSIPQTTNNGSTPHRRDSRLMAAHHQALLRVFVDALRERISVRQFVDQLFGVAEKLDASSTGKLTKSDALLAASRLPAPSPLDAYIVSTTPLEAELGDPFFLYLIKGYLTLVPDAEEVNRRSFGDNPVYSPKKK